MKKRSILIIIVFSMVFITACQKSPENPIVRRKDIDNIIKKGVENPIIADMESGDDLRKPLEAPEKFKMEIESIQKNLKVHVDADVVVPNTPSLPIVRVGKRVFDEKDGENLFNVFGKDAKAIDPDSLYTSEYYLNKVKELREEQDTMEEKTSGISKEELELELPELDADNFDDYIKNQIDELLEKAAQAPEEYVELEPDFSFKVQKDPAGNEDVDIMGEYAKVFFIPNDKIVSQIEVVPNMNGAGGYASYLRDNTKYNEVGRLETAYSEEAGDYYNPDDWTLPDMDQGQALKLAEDVISNLGLTDFECLAKRVAPIDAQESFDTEDGVPSELDFNKNKRGIYEFMFTRKVNNVPITYTNNQGLTTVHEAYFAPWMYEKVHIFVDDEGVLYFKWNSPYEVKEIVSDASKLLIFSDIEDVFKSMMPINYDNWDRDERYSYHVEITEARLGLMRVTEKDVGDSGLLIPVWDFFGVLTTKGKAGQLNISGNEGKQYYNHVSFLTINAIDGTIIDRNLGY